MKKLVILLLVLSMMILGLSSCKKKTSQEETSPQTQDAKQYEIQAEKEINADNMDAEIDRLQQEIESELENL